jgi:hypothetical protein
MCPARGTQTFGLAGEFNVGNDRTEVVFSTDDDADTEVTDAGSDKPDRHIECFVIHFEIDHIDHLEDFAETPTHKHAYQQAEKDRGQGGQGFFGREPLNDDGKNCQRKTQNEDVEIGGFFGGLFETYEQKRGGGNEKQESDNIQ